MAGLVGIYTTDALDTVHSKKLIGEMAKEISYTHNEIIDQGYGNKLSVARVHHGVINPQPQPIFSEDSSICIFMDGEVFDYDSEKRWLIDQGHRFRMQDNDAEYCLHFYEEYGTEAFSKLNGSFIIVLHHLDSGELLLVNDRISSRPVFYRWDGKQLIFASQLRPILKAPDLSPELDIQAVLEFFAFRSVLSDGTLYKDVKILPPASILRIRNAELSIRQYWRWKYEGEQYPEGYYVEAFAAALKRAVQRRTRGDHRIGLLLSGGLDSRTLLAADTEKRISVAFTLADFENREVRIARKIAAATGRRHIFLQRDIDHYYRLVDEAVDIGDGMYGFDHAHNLGFFDRIRTESDVLLHAFGFDTLFKALFVPPRYVKMFGQYLPIPVPAIPREASDQEVISIIVGGSLAGQAARLFRLPETELMERLRSSAAMVLRTSLGTNVRVPADKMADIFYFSAAYRWFTYLHVLHNRAFIDERTVALDNELLDLAFNTPVEFKFGGRLIKKVLARLSPRIAAITNANAGLPAITPVWQEWLLLTAQAELTRRGILKSAPLPHPAFTHGSWPNFAELIRYNQNLKEAMRKTLEDPACLNKQLFDKDYIKSIYHKHIRGEADYTSILLLLLTFGRWQARQNRDNTNK